MKKGRDLAWILIILLLLMIGWNKLKGNAGTSFSGLKSLQGIGELKHETQSEESAAKTIPEISAKKIRVLLQSNEEDPSSFAQLTITSAGSFRVSCGSDVIEYGAAEVFVPGQDQACNGPWILNGSAGFSVAEISRSWEEPLYQGALYVYKNENRYILINEVPLETYTAGVTASEVPSAFGLEARKAQAVCARSCAVSHLNHFMYPAYEAHVDDGTGCQVYNNQEITEEAVEAAEQTAGIILTYDNEAIDPYFFAVSWGHTTDGTVWQDSDEVSEAWLPASTVTVDREPIDFSDEETFRYYMDHPMESYDKNSSLFRWSVKMDSSVLSESLAAYLKERGYEEAGAIRHIEASERGPGGVIHQLKLTGEKGIVILTGQNVIRSALANEAWSIRRQDGTESDGWKMLPSAYFYIDEDNSGDSVTFLIKGGGFGHGAGMSQDGAEGMAEQGFSYKEILSYFYPGTRLTEAE